MVENQVVDYEGAVGVIATCLAGLAAESLRYNDNDESGGETDKAEARRVFCLILESAKLPYDEGIRELFLDLCMRYAIGLLHYLWEVVEKVGEALLARRSLCREELLSLTETCDLIAPSSRRFATHLLAKTLSL